MKSKKVKEKPIKQIKIINSENYLLRVVQALPDSISSGSILIQSKMDGENNKFWVGKKTAKKLAIALLKLS